MVAREIVVELVKRIRQCMTEKIASLYTLTGFPVDDGDIIVIFWPNKLVLRLS